MTFSDVDALESLVLTSPIGICILDAATLRCELANDAFLSMSGKSRDGMYGKYYWETFAETAPYHSDILTNVIKEGKSYRSEEKEVVLIRYGKSETVFVNFAYIPLPNEDGSITKVAVWLLENTTQVQERQKIQELNEEMTAANEELVAANEELTVLNEELIQTETELQELNKHLEERVAERTEELVQTQQTLLQLNNELEERVQQRTQELTDSETRFRMISDNIAQLAWMAEADGNIYWYNKRWYDYTGSSPDELQGFGWQQFHHPDYVERVTRKYVAALANDTYWEDTFPLKGADGKYRWFLSKAVALQNEQGIITKWFGTNTDVTTEVTAKDKIASFSEELQATNEELRRLNKASQQAKEDLQLLNNELEESNRSLTIADANLQVALQSADLAMWSLDLTTQKLYMSDQYRKMFGFPATGNITLAQVMQVTHPDDISLLTSAIENAIAKKEDANLQYRIRHGVSGERKWIKGKGKIITDGNDNPISILGMNIDITEQVLAFEKEQELSEELIALNEELSASNEELLASNNAFQIANQELTRVQNDLRDSLILSDLRESRFRRLIQQAPVAINLFYTRDLVIESANDKMLELWGRTSDVNGKTLIEALPETKGQPLFATLNEVFTTGVPFYGNESKALLMKNGKLTEAFYNLIYKPIKDEHGTTIGIIQVATDITEQVRFRKQIENAEETLRIATESAELGTWSYYPANDELVTSTRFKEIFGCQPKNLLSNQEKLAQIETDYRDAALTTMKESFESGVPFSIEYPIVQLGSGKQRWVRSFGKLVKGDEKHAAYMSGVLADITEQKKDEQRKNDFIGMVSHELKTPLTSLSGYMQIVQGMAKRNKDEMAANMLEKAGKQVDRMNKLINGFLNVSRLESGKIQIDKQDFDMASLIKEVEEESIATIASHKVIFAPVEYTIVSADKDKIGQVINNLISNAVKYSPNGTTINIACITIDNYVQVSVSDQGMGIEKGNQERLFDRYYRVENNLSKTISGFGIGLYLSAEIIHRHNGKIWVESEVGKGSTFCFSLPL